MFRTSQPSFSGGEIGPDLEARYDTAKYQTALRKARNCLMSVGGGVYARPGTEAVGEVKDSAYRSWAVPFQFSNTQSYCLEFGQNVMRVIYQGGYVTRPELLITAATNTNPLTMTIPASGYVAGWDVYFTGVEGMTEVNGRILRVLSVVGDVVTLDADATGWGVFTGSGGGVAGDAEGGEGGQPPPPAPDDPTPPYEDQEPPPPRCVWVHAYLSDTLRAGDARTGDLLILLDEDGSGSHDGVVQANLIASSPLRKLRTISGIVLTVSDTAPIPVQDGAGVITYRPARRLRGDEIVPVQDEDGFRWEALASITSLPSGPVARVSTWDGVYAAGDQPGRYIFTHNLKPIADGI